MHYTKAGKILNMLEVLSSKEYGDVTVYEYQKKYKPFYGVQPGKKEIDIAHTSMRRRSKAGTKTFKIQQKQQYKRQRYTDKLQRKLDKSRRGPGLIRRVAGAIANNPVTQDVRRDVGSKLLR